MEKTSVIRPDLTSPGAYLISSLCTMSWSSVTSGKWPSWSVSKCSRSWRHRSQKPRVYKAFGGRRHTEGRCSSIDENGKSRHSVWLSDDVWQEVDAFYKLDNCPIRNEFVEKALRQYCGRLRAERTGAYLPRALQEVLEGTLGVFGERLGRLLLKLAVEHNMTNHLLGGDMDMTRDEYSKMRGSSVREVSATHGTISFKDVLLFYKED